MSKYPFEELKAVGDSFDVISVDPEKHKNVLNSVKTNVSRVNRKKDQDGTHMYFRARDLKDKIRVIAVPCDPRTQHAKRLAVEIIVNRRSE